MRLDRPVLLFVAFLFLLALAACAQSTATASANSQQDPKHVTSRRSGDSPTN